MAAHLHIKYLQIRTKIEFQPKKWKADEFVIIVVEKFHQKIAAGAFYD
jgi:hypothetical protein